MNSQKNSEPISKGEIPDIISLIGSVIERVGFYHVFLREKDAACRDGKKPKCEPLLLRTFLSQHKAAEWIIKYGRDIIEYEEQENRSRPCVLTIIFVDQSEEDIDIEDIPTEPWCICEKKYPTFSFTTMGKEMLIEEICDRGNSIEAYDVMPYWIFHVEEETNKVIYGWSQTEFDRYSKHYTYFKSHRKKRKICIKEYLKDPKDFAIRKGMPRL